MLEWKFAQAAGHIARDAVTDVFKFDIPKNKHRNCKDLQIVEG